MFCFLSDYIKSQKLTEFNNNNKILVKTTGKLETKAMTDLAGYLPE